MPIFAEYRYTGRPTQMSLVNSGVTGPNLTKFLRDVAGSLPPIGIAVFQSISECE